MHSLRFKLILLWVAFGALLVAVTNLIAFRTALDVQFQQLRQTLMAIATTGALQINGDDHQRIPPEAASRERSDYQVLVAQLRALRNANSAIRFAYTLRPSTIPGTWLYIGDADERAPSFPGEAYEASRYPAMLAGLQAPSADPALTVDESGVLLSGYAPIRNRDGKAVAVLGIDMAGEQVKRMQQALRDWLLLVLSIGLGSVLILGIRMAAWVTRPIQTLVRGTQRIGAGDLDYRVPIDSPDEVGTLARAFNRMAALLADSLRQLQEHVVSTIQSLSMAIEAKDRYTRGHSERVHHYAVKVAKRLGLPEAQVDLIRKISLLHDVGKIGIKEDILLKPSKLTPEEFAAIARHPDVGYKILAPLKLPQEALDIVRHHHERLDGRGYPAGLQGNQIPLPVAIVSAADAFDAMTGHRPYRPTPLTFIEAADELRRCAGTQFKPEVVDALLDVLRQEGKLG